MDIRVRTGTTDGILFVSSLFSASMGHSLNAIELSSLWKVKAPPRVVLAFGWLAIQALEAQIDNC